MNELTAVAASFAALGREVVLGATGGDQAGGVSVPVEIWSPIGVIMSRRSSTEVPVRRSSVDSIACSALGRVSHS